MSVCVFVRYSITHFFSYTNMKLHIQWQIKICGILALFLSQSIFPVLLLAYLWFAICCNRVTCALRARSALNRVWMVTHVGRHALTTPKLQPHSFGWYNPLHVVTMHNLGKLCCLTTVQQPCYFQNIIATLSLLTFVPRV